MVIKTCATCKHQSKWPSQFPCKGCISYEGIEEWEAKEAEEVMPDGS
jgi:hypothetical protein